MAAKCRWACCLGGAGKQVVMCAPEVSEEYPTYGCTAWGVSMYERAPELQAHHGCKLAERIWEACRRRKRKLPGR